MEGQSHSFEPWCMEKETKIEGWSKEPIKTTGCYSLNSEGWAQLGLIGGGTRGKANAERIVQCVNAMAGIADPEKFISHLQEFLKYSLTSSSICACKENMRDALSLFPEKKS